MKNWSQALEDGLLTGTIAGIASAAALAVAGMRESGSAVAPINAVSHIAWGDRALSANRPDLAHTLTGGLLHAGSGLFWGVLFEKLFGTRRAASLTETVGKAALATAAIAVVDLKLVPDRLTPGFERRLSPSGVALVFAALGTGLVIGTRLADRR
jgi:hypothetical protein